MIKIFFNYSNKKVYIYYCNISIIFNIAFSIASTYAI